jgi:hypothetical protein
LPASKTTELLHVLSNLVDHPTKPIDLQEAKTLIAGLYSKYTFKYAHNKPEEQAYRITSSPKFGVPMTIHSRK